MSWQDKIDMLVFCRNKTKRKEAKNLVNIDKLNGKIAENRLNRKKIAAALGISTPTLRRRIKEGIFYNVEIDILVKLLKIENPNEIFFENILS